MALQVGIALAMTLPVVTAGLTRPGDDEYIIWPASTISPAAAEFITLAVADFAGGADEVYVSRVLPAPVPLYWLARLPASAIESIRRISEVKWPHE